MEAKETFRRHIEAVEPGLTANLITPKGLEALKRFSGLLPFDTATSFGFETRLGDRAAICDFFLLITAGGHGPAMLAGKSTVAGLSPAISGDPFWERMSELFRAWTGISPLLAGKLELIWLEFDSNGTAYNTTPNIFIRLREAAQDDHAGLWKDMQQALDEIYRILFGISFPEELGITLRQCYDALPPQAGLYQIGFMVPRKTETIRLILTNLRGNQLYNYLRDIGWPGDRSAIAEMLDRYAVKFDYTVCNIHIGRDVLPYFGLEMYLKEMRQPQWEPRWNDIFSLLVSGGLALEPKCNDLRGYCGKRTIHGLFPMKYISGINHLKLVYRKGSPLECKAYFGTMIRKFTIDKIDD
jgi:hypothetical protein